MVSASPVFFLVKDFVKTQDATAAFFALSVSVSSVAMVAANFAGGFLADHIGRKRVILAGSAILAPSLFSYTVAPNVFWVVAIYFSQMFGVQLFQPAFTAFVADLSKVSSRGKAFGHYNLFWIGATVPAPLIGGFLADNFGLRFPFALASIIAVIALVTSFGLAEIVHKPSEAVENRQVEHDSENVLMPLVSVLLIFGLIGFLNGMLSGMLSPLIRIYTVFNLGANATELGLTFSLGSGLVTTLIQIPGGRLTDRIGRKPLMLVSLLGAPFLIAMAYSNSLLQFILATAGLVAVGNISAPAYSAWLMDLVPKNQRARTSGLINAVTGAGTFIGPQLSTWIYRSQANIVIAFAATGVPWILQGPLILKLKETKMSS